jgi:hypothetical protein
MRTPRTIFAVLVVIPLTLFLAVRAARPSVGSSATPEQIQTALQGSWLVTVTPATGALAPAPYQSLITVGANGGLVETDTAIALKGFSASPGHGAAAQTDLGYSMTFLKLVADSNAKLVGKIKYRETGKLDPTLDSYKGMGRADLLSTSGTVLITYTATIEATRVKVESLP